MARNLYIFVDECGTPHLDDYFTVAGCWCVSENSPRPTLNETRIGVLRLLAELDEVASDQTEIKGKDLSQAGIDTLFRNHDEYVYRDNTICHDALPWASRPVRYTTAEVDAGLGREAFSNFGHDLDTPKLVQTMMLLTVLRPLLYGSTLEARHYDHVRVVLDSDVWGSAIGAVHDHDRTEGFEFRTMDSQKAPGIQFADVAARVRRMSRLGDEYQVAESELDALELE